MTADISGTWEGTYQTGIAQSYAVDVTKWELWDLQGSTPQLVDIKLSILSQDSYKDYGSGLLISRLVGEMSSGGGGLTPVVGFVNSAGQVKLSFYSSLSDNWVFTGRLTTRGLIRDISGGWLSTSKDYFDKYRFGILGVKKYGLSLSDRTYVVNARHVF